MFHCIKISSESELVLSCRVGTCSPPLTPCKAFTAFSTNWLTEGSTSRYTCKEQQISRAGYLSSNRQHTVTEQRAKTTAFSLSIYRDNSNNIFITIIFRQVFSTKVVLLVFIIPQNSNSTISWLCFSYR